MNRLPLSFVFINIFLLMAGVGCESHHFTAARHKDTVQAYLRYLAQHPEGESAEQAQDRVEVLRYQVARQMNRPLGCRMYLDQYPEGKYVGDCRRKLARLALDRARTPADYQLIQERYWGSADAERSLARLPGLLAQQSIDRKDPAAMQGFLDRFPHSKEAPAVRAQLATIRYAAILPADRQGLESFSQEFAGTLEADRALKYIHDLLVGEVQQGRDPHTLEQLKARFPESPQLPRLAEVVRLRQVDQALTHLDLKALGRLEGVTASGESIPALIKWCKAKSRRCHALRAKIRQAHRWEPAQALPAMRALVFDADTLISWEAVAALGWTRDRAAGDLLLELMGSTRFSTIWAAEKALWRWFGRLPAADRPLWGQRHLRRAFHKSNSDEAQRAAYLRLLTGRSTAGTPLLKEIMGRPGRGMSASYLLNIWQRRRNQPAASWASAAIRQHAMGRLKQLGDAFPERLHKDSLAAAILAERELFALSRALDQLGSGAVNRGSFSSIRREVSSTLSRWRAQISGIKKTFLPAAEPRLEAEVTKHQQGRARALRVLQRDRNPVARAAVGAICRQAPLPGCR